jgi:hypothetical protein
MHDETATTIVVEQIPEDKFNGDAIKGFFAQFGNIADITLRNHKRIALIQFEDHRAANDAYNSPKVVFDNRFVKVYWHKPQKTLRGPDDRNFQKSSNTTAAADVTMEDTEQPVDPVELARRQEEAQRKYEASKKQREEQQQQKLELDLKLRAIEAERSKMALKLAHKAGGVAVLSAPTSIGGETGSDSTTQTEGLRAQLAKLEAEAKSLGIDPDASAHGAAWGGFPPRGRGRGSFRGRPGRAGFYPVGRGGWAGGAVKRLDNRPKIVAISFIDGNYEDHDEALRQYLLFSSTENVTLTQHPARPNVALLAFTERYLGEIFMKAASAPDFPLAGKIELAWHKPETDDTLTEDTTNHNDITSQEPGKNGDAAPTSANAKEIDYDVAADDDLWG